MVSAFLAPIPFNVCNSFLLALFRLIAETSIGKNKQKTRKVFFIAEKKSFHIKIYLLLPTAKENICSKSKTKLRLGDIAGLETTLLFLLFFYLNPA